MWPCLTIGCKCWGQFETWRRPTRGRVQRAGNWRCLLASPFLPLPPSVRWWCAKVFYPTSLVEVWHLVIPWDAQVPARQVEHAPQQSSAGTTGPCATSLPSDPFSHVKGSAVLATAQIFPKYLPQEIARDFWHRQHCSQPRGPFTLPGKPPGAKMRGARSLQRREERVPKHSSLPKWTVGPFPVKFPKTTLTVHNHFGTFEPTSHTNSLLGLPGAPW